MIDPRLHTTPGFFLWLTGLNLCFTALAQAHVAGTERPVAQAIQLEEGERMQVDARLDEGAWRRAAWIREMTQKDPEEGVDGAEATEVAFFFDENALYIGARLWTPLTGRIDARLSPRDDMGQNQGLFITFDSFHDRRTGYTFGTMTSGVQVDWYTPEDEEYNQVMSWNPNWETRTRIHEDHWVVEARIPFSQLRFNDVDEQVWGLQIDRWTPERDAEDYWVMIPRSMTGWSSHFGELRGIRGIRPSKRFEFLPYMAGEAFMPAHPDDADPFVDRINGEQRIGGDLKMGLGPNLTLDATINPDFGQVEADPAEVNLSAFETFFSERRPFFLEGDALLRGRGPRYYYSRRIGSQPRVNLPDSVTHADVPRNTTILGAAKVTGRLPGGTSIGVLAALTDEESAETYNADGAGRQYGETLVEPRAGSAVLRLQQELGKSGSLFGVSLTGLARDLDDSVPLREEYTENAFSGGVDGLWRFKDGDYQLAGWWGGSRVEGDSTVIARLQRSSARYYQRPDVDHVHYDPGRTTLSGWAANLELGKPGGEHLNWWLGTQAESPGFELNDLGSLSSADDVDAWAEISWEENRGQGFFRRWNVEWDAYAAWNFGGLPTSRGTELEGWGQFRNFWTLEGGVHHAFGAYSDHLSRGGITLATRAGNSAWYSVESAQLQDPNSVSWGGSMNWGTDGRLSMDHWFFTRLRPNPHWEFRINPGWTRDVQPLQYLGRYDTQGGERVLFARLDYREIKLNTRVRYTVNPRLRFELYVEPFQASIRYSDPGRALGARSDIVRRYADMGVVTREEGTWTLPETTPSGDPLQVRRDDFEFGSWRSNVVVRWDWRLGSSFYFIWQQDRGKFRATESPDRVPDPFDALSIAGDNLVALKLSYWFTAG